MDGGERAALHLPQKQVQLALLILLGSVALAVSVGIAIDFWHKLHTLFQACCCWSTHGLAKIGAAVPVMMGASI